MKAKSARSKGKTASNGEEDVSLRVIDAAEKKSWLRLIRTPFVGPTTFWGLLHHYGTARQALCALPSFASYSSRLSSASVPSLADIEAEIEKADRAGLRLVAAGEGDYPPLLAQLEYPPPLIYVKGCHNFWSKPPIAIVGSRAASAAGLKFAAYLAQALAEEGFLVVSGLARGIDIAAHRAVLKFGTAAMLPGGLDMIYPPEHKTISDEILTNGVLISECPPGFQARAQDFPRRNRLISGSSLGVIVVEAAAKSGSLITARIAAEQNREVFAVPGHPLDPRAAGTNDLLKQGAILTTCVDDVTQALSNGLGASVSKLVGLTQSQSTPQSASSYVLSNLAQAAFKPLDLPQMQDTKRALLDLLSFAPIDIDELTRNSGLEPRDVSAALLLLDLEGRLERHRRGTVSLKS